MLITPIFWPPETLSGTRRAIFVDTNPLFHMVDIVRAPLLGQFPQAISYLVVAVITAGGWYLTYVVFRHFRKRIAYWS